MTIRFILAATLVLNFTTSANASFNCTDEDKSFVTSEVFIESVYVALSSQNTISGTQIVQLGIYKNVKLTKLKMSKLKTPNQHVNFV